MTEIVTRKNIGKSWHFITGNITRKGNAMTPEQVQKLTKMERMQMVLEYAKSLGFVRAMPIYWGEKAPGYGEYSPFESADPNELKEFDIGLTFETEVTALWLIHEGNESDDGKRLVFDTKEEAEAFLRAEGGAA